MGLVLAGDDANAPLRGMGRSVSPGAFGHNGAGGQVAWADPATGLSFAYLTNGLDSPDFAKRDTSSVVSIGYGGAPAPPELVRRIGEMFPGRTPSNGYGLTETSSVTTMNAGDDYVSRPDSVGAPVPICDLKVVDERGDAMPAGSIGELWIKGPNVVKGYWGKPAETAATFSDGWLHTGDVARVDEEGFVYIVDRAKDIVIRRRGEHLLCRSRGGAVRTPCRQRRRRHRDPPSGAGRAGRRRGPDQGRRSGH